MAEHPLDLSEYSSDRSAARALHKFLREEFEADAKLYSPEETEEIRRGNGAWMVAWEGGPYEWSIKLTGGESMIADWPEMAEYDHEPSPEVVGFYGEGDWFAEPYYKFDLLFYPE